MDSPAADPPVPELGPEGRTFVKNGLQGIADRIRPREIMRLEAYIDKAWEILEPGKRLDKSWHIGLISEYLEAVSAGDLLKLIVNIYPRSLKSTIVSVCWPTWVWGSLHLPEKRFMFVSHEASLALDFSVSRRLIMESDWYRREFPWVVLSSDQNEKKLVQNTRRGRFISTSTHGAATGKGGDYIVFDDYIDPQSAESDTEREAALKAWENKFSTRLDDPKLGAIVAIEQRTHPRDFTWKLLQEGGYEHLAIPSDNYKKEPLRYVFPRSKREIVIEPGAATSPDRKPLETVAQQRKRMGSRSHDAQERQNPQADGNIMFKRINWRFYDSLDDVLWMIDARTGVRMLRSWDDIIQSWDCAFKELTTSDFVVGQVWGKRGADRWILDQFREQTGISGTMKAIKSMSEKWPAAARKLIEDKANGPAVMELLAHEVPGLIPVNPEGGKIVRARATEPIQEAGNIYLPSPRIAHWVEDFIARCEKFPNMGGDHDDEIDAMTQANNYFTMNPGPSLTIY